jgi:tripartite-type tricarboxylate transporter receptor subunit TctC
MAPRSALAYNFLMHWLRMRRHRRPIRGIVTKKCIRERTMNTQSRAALPARRMAVAAAMIVGLFGLLAVPAAWAQVGGSNTMRIVVGTPPGGAVDAYARIVGDHMARTLNQNVIIENKPGANGNISAMVVRDAPADGRTLWVGTQAMTEINPSAYANLKWSIDDFIPLVRGIEAPLVLVTHPSVPAKTLDELIAWVKKNPGKLSFASFSPGTPSAFLGSQLNTRFGTDLTHVPYRGSGPQVKDLIAGHALFGFTQIQTAMPQIKAGKLNAIATTGEKRSHFLPDTPTFAELGYPEFNAEIWFGLLVHSGTPADTVAKLLDAAKAAHADPGVRAKLEASGFNVSGMTGPSLMTNIKQQIDRWAKIVKATGFKAN